MFVNAVLRDNFKKFSCNAFNIFIFWIFLLGFMSLIYYQENRFDTVSRCDVVGKFDADMHLPY